MTAAICVDTNVLLRMLVDDAEAPQQVILARQLIEAARRIHVAQVVFTETMWVLMRRYQFDRSSIVQTARQLLDHPAIVCENRDLLSSAVELFARSPIGFGDALALAASKALAIPLYTFDRKLARLDGARAVQPGSKPV